MSCELAKTARADELLSAIQRGDINGMSFSFTADEDDTENGVSYENTGERSADGKEIWLRHVKRVTGLYDVTIAGHPAYPQTDIAQREIDEFLDSKIGHIETEEEKAEREQREADDKAEQERIQREQEEIAAKALQRQHQIRNHKEREIF